MRKLNLNDYVYVHLTEEGLKVLKERYEALKAKYPYIGPYYDRPIDDDGYTRFQLWELMEIFGEYIKFNARLVFDPNIMIEDFSFDDADEIYVRTKQNIRFGSKNGRRS